MPPVQAVTPIKHHAAIPSETISVIMKMNGKRIGRTIGNGKTQMTRSMITRTTVAIIGDAPDSNSRSSLFEAPWFADRHEDFFSVR